MGRSLIVQMGNTTLLILESWGYNWQISLCLVIITLSTCSTRL
jgi:hypothetical protein